MDVLTSETCWALYKEIIKQVTSVGLSLLNYQDDARSNKHKIHLYMFIARNIYNIKYILFIYVFVVYLTTLFVIQR